MCTKFVFSYRAFFARLVLLVLNLISVAGSGRAEPFALGVVQTNQTVGFDLRFTNNMETPVMIGGIETSCDCLTAVAEPVPVAPGGSTRIVCSYRSATPGKIAVTVSVVGGAATDVLETITVTGFVAEKSWLVSVEEVMAGLDGFTLVDTRSAEEYTELRIPRSLHVPLFALKVRVDLRTRRAVLVDDGFAPEVLLEEVAALRSRGFSHVSVLAGGLTMWARHGGALAGTAPTPLTAARLSPADFARARLAGDWHVIELTGANTGTQPVTPLTALAELTRALAALPASSKGPETANVLVIAPDDSMYAHIESHLATKERRPIFYLCGGRRALEAYRAEQAALVAHKGNLFQTKTIKRGPIAAGGCRSCGK